MAKVFVGHDWAEAHHDVFVEDETGKRLASARLPEGVEGVRRFHELVAGHAEEPGDVMIATETDRGCSSARWSPPAIRCWRSIRCRRRVIGNGTRHQARSPTPATHERSQSSPVWTATIIVRSQVTAT